jgi:hypothetical protein
MDVTPFAFASSLPMTDPDAGSRRSIWCWSPCARGARLDQAALVGEHDGLDAIPHAELGEDPGDVRLHRRLAEKELVTEVGSEQASAATA